MYSLKIVGSIQMETKFRTLKYRQCFSRCLALPSTAVTDILAVFVGKPSAIAGAKIHRVEQCRLFRIHHSIYGKFHYGIDVVLHLRE